MSGQNSGCWDGIRGERVLRGRGEGGEGQLRQVHEPFWVFRGQFGGGEQAQPGAIEQGGASGVGEHVADPFCGQFGQDRHVDGPRIECRVDRNILLDTPVES